MTTLTINNGSGTVAARSSQFMGLVKIIKPEESKVSSRNGQRERERERDIRQETVVFAGGSFGGHVGPNMSRLIVTPSATINRNVLGGNYPQNMERRQGIVNCRENSGRTRKNSDRWRVSYIPTPFGLDSID